MNDIDGVCYSGVQKISEARAQHIVGRMASEENDENFNLNTFLVFSIYGLLKTLIIQIFKRKTVAHI